MWIFNGLMQCHSHIVADFVCLMWLPIWVLFGFWGRKFVFLCLIGYFLNVQWWLLDSFCDCKLISFCFGCWEDAGEEKDEKVWIFVYLAYRKLWISAIAVIYLEVLECSIGSIGNLDKEKQSVGIMHLF